MRTTAHEVRNLDQSKSDSKNGKDDSARMKKSENLCRTFLKNFIEI